MTLCTSNNTNTETQQGKLITKMDFGDKWPFTVNEGRLECEGFAVIFHANGKAYGVNGAATGQKKYSDIKEIWADDPKYPDMNIKIDIGPIIEKGLKLCE